MVREAPDIVGLAGHRCRLVSMRSMVVVEGIMIDYRLHGSLAWVVAIVGLLAFANWALSGINHGLTDANTALLLLSFFLIASAAVSLWQTRERLALVTSISEIKRWNMLIVVIGLVNAFTQTNGTGETSQIHSFFWSTVAAINFVNAFIRPQQKTS